MSNANIDDELVDRSSSDSVNLQSAPEVIAAARNLLTRLQDDTDQRDSVLSLYILLWKSLEQTHKPIHDNSHTGCCAAFWSLIVDAEVSTAKLLDSKVSLISLAETAMRYYSLVRTLDKLCDAFFIAWENVGSNPVAGV